MFCPRCGSPNPDTTKFCRQCGLGLEQITGYIASGGTAHFSQQQPASADLISKATEGMMLKHRLILTIMLLAFSPAIFGVLSRIIGIGGSLAGISAVLMPIGIVWAVMRYKAQKCRLQEAMMQQQIYPPMPTHPMPTHMMPPVAPYSLPQAGQQPIQQSYQPPVYQPSPPPTNPLKPPSSVIEDETRRLQDRRD